MLNLGARFWDRVDKTPTYGCWNWSGGSTTKGYGTYFISGKKQYAHRLSWANHNGEMPPKGMQIDHTCFNRSCVNPQHLDLVTLTENTKRRRLAVKGRWPGLAGSYWDPELGLWSAVIVYKGELILCGNHTTRGRAEIALDHKRREIDTNYLDTTTNNG